MDSKCRILTTMHMLAVAASRIQNMPLGFASLYHYAHRLVMTGVIFEIFTFKMPTKMLF